ncbi:78 kDa glucose-regulated protein-like [Tropilaelaps mercedesae]|uniref:78 kDa glucose-regulated protein-like n=1 Tax=Tropilaelaps mercedesae TaxID=418985 RepID=A0A1V9XGT8_9ACAR|nr:78 kDa glucose-regulated protein-like [Tropilaelaps mercedesae]
MTQLSDKDKLGGKLSDSDKKSVEEAVENAIKWLESNADAEADEMKAQKKELEAIIHPIMSKMYQGSGGVPPGGDGDDANKDEL